MKHRLGHSLVLLAIGVALLPLTSQAQLKITEVEASANTGPDWWELTNLGEEAVDITNYKMDDSSASFDLGVLLSGDVTSIGSGQSVVFFEIAGKTPFTVQGFRDWWGLDANILVGTYSGSGVGLGAGGDGVNIFTSTGTLVDSVSFGSSTPGTTFGWNPNTRTFGALSEIGVNGAFMAAKDGDIGSPGAAIVPEPSILSLFGLAFGGLLLRRTSKKHK